MKIYKVYAQCVKRVKAIEEITSQDVYNEIEQAVNDMVNNGDLVIYVDDEEDDNEYSEKFGELVAKAQHFFESNKYFECGDFIIKVSEEYPERANSYGWTKDFN